MNSSLFVLQNFNFTSSLPQNALSSRSTYYLVNTTSFSLLDKLDYNIQLAAKELKDRFFKLITNSEFSKNSCPDNVLEIIRENSIATLAPIPPQNIIVAFPAFNRPPAQPAAVPRQGNGGGVQRPPRQQRGRQIPGQAGPADARRNRFIARAVLEIISNARPNLFPGFWLLQSVSNIILRYFGGNES